MMNGPQSKGWVGNKLALAGRADEPAADGQLTQDPVLRLPHSQ